MRVADNRLSSDSPDSEIGCLPRRVRLQLARNGHALKSQRGFRPVTGKTQELLSLLFGPSPIGPSKAISCVCVIFIDSGHGASLPFSGSTTGLSAIDICRAGPWSDCSTSIARRKRNAYCGPISCLKLKNEAPAVGREPSGGRRLSIGCSRKKTTWALERPHVGGERNNQPKGQSRPQAAA